MSTDSVQYLERFIGVTATGSNFLSWRSPADQLTGSQGDIPVFLGRVLIALRLQIPKRGNQLRARLAGADHLVEEAARRGYIGIRKLLTEFGDFFGAQRGGIVGGVEFALVENIDRALRTHDRQFRGGPRVVEVCANVFARHDAVRA